MNVPIGQSISKCKEEIRTILYRLKAFYEPCDVDTARGFTNNFIQGLNKVFNDFLTEEFADQPNNQSNVEDEVEEPTVSSSVPIVKEEDNSKDVWILESDEEICQIKAKPKSINETPMPMEVETQHENNHSCSSMNVSTNDNNSNVTGVEMEKPKKHQRSNKIPTTCDVCKAEYKQTFSLINHRKIHLDQFDYHCRICLLGFFQKFDRNCHENKCIKRRYECYICEYHAPTSSRNEKHMRTHTDMRSYYMSKAKQKSVFEKNAMARQIGEKHVAAKKVMIKTENMKKMEEMQQKYAIGVIDLTDD